jgi:type IV secretory pathway TrbD component
VVILKWALVFLALAAALGYFLMGAGVIHAADLTLDDAPPGFTWIAGAFYVIAGLLLFLKKRWIYAAFPVINVLVIAVFIFMWTGRTDVLFSLPGLMTKIPQILLETGLIYLLVKSKPVANPAPAK